jgi:hypothetical protein
MLTGPPDQSPPVEADFGPSHDAITAELPDLTWQFLTHASPTVRAGLGQFFAHHGQHPVAGLGCLQLSAARHHPRGARRANTIKIKKWGQTRSHNTRPHSAGGAKTPFHLGPEVVLESHACPRRRPLSLSGPLIRKSPVSVIRRRG